MGLAEAFVVFVIFWWLIFLPILSAGSRSQEEAGEIVPGSERGAPEETKLGNKILIASGGALAVTALFWIVIKLGWLAGVFGATA